MSIISSITAATDSPMSHRASSKSQKQDVSTNDRPAPRYCHLVKWPDFEGYGFNLHAEKGKAGQFVGKVDDNSPAQSAGLREGDRIIEVNGVNIANENHRQVVERIKAIANETRLLVIDEAGDAWYKERDIVIKGTQENVVFIKTQCRNETQQQQVNDGKSENVSDRLNGESQSIKNLTQSTVVINEQVDEEVTTEPIPDLVLNGVHEDDDEVERVEITAKSCPVDSTATLSATVEETATATAAAATSTTSSTCQDESSVKTVESTGNTHLNSETLGEVELSPSSSSSSNNSESISPTVIVVESNVVPVDVEEQIGEETAKVVLGPEEDEETSQEDKIIDEKSTNASSNDFKKNVVNNMLNNNSVNQSNINNNNSIINNNVDCTEKSKFNVNEANNNQTLPKVEKEMKSDSDIGTTNGTLPITACVTVASNVSSTDGIVDDTTDGKESTSNSIPASPTSIKSAASSNASSNGNSSTSGSNGYKHCSLTGIVDPSLEQSLNMSVSQIRQFLSQKRKTDPRKVQMDVKTKYNIVSSM